MDEKRIRVRLKFQDCDLLTSQQIEQGLAQSWYLVLLEDAHTVADVAFDIRTAFHLEESCPNGLSLEVDGFVLPASQPARLLKDSDLIRIKRRTNIQGQISHEVRNTYDHIPSKEWLAQCSLGPCKVYPSDGARPAANGLERFTGYHGVQLRALDEFEKETGGYESEQEGEMETEVSLDGELKTLKETKPSPICRKEKGRGGKMHEGINAVVSEIGKSKRTRDLEAGQELAIVQVKDKCNSVERHALVELEKETGNEKEEEDGTLTVFSTEGKCSQKKLEAASQSPLSKQERRKKKRKKKEANIEGKDQVPQKVEEGPSSNRMLCTVEHVNNGDQRLKRKKRKHPRSDPAEAGCEDGVKEWITSSGKKKKRQESTSTNKIIDVRESMLKIEAAVDKIGRKKRKKEADLDSPAEKLRNPAMRTCEASIPARTPKSKVKGQPTPAPTPTPVQEQRPSRSARRKKAKRQWLREQAKVALLIGVETKVSDSSSSEVQIAQEELVCSPVGREVLEVEAEEEVLPILVCSGHIRFEAYDKDETADQSRPSMPELLLADQVKTKRQGQNWGQEKSAKKHNGGKRWAFEPNNVQSPEASCDARVNTKSCDQVNPVSFEKHPVLDGFPQEGDVLAYRLVELTASWTPEISPYRVGIVAHWDQATNMIRVEPDPDYPCFGEKAFLDGEEDRWDWKLQEGEVVGPYDENGALEIDFSSLVEVRLMESFRSGKHEVVLIPSAETEKDLGPTTEGAHQVDKSASEPVVDIRDSTPTGELHGVEDGVGAKSSSAWETLLSEELEKKRTELCQRAGVDKNALTGTTAPSEEVGGATVRSEGGELPHQPKSGKGRKHKFLKSAGVGSIVALLRAQQAL